MERKNGWRRSPTTRSEPMVALGRQIAEEGTGTERQKQNARLWADAAKVTLGDPQRHNPKATVPKATAKQ